MIWLVATHSMPVAVGWVTCQWTKTIWRSRQCMLCLHVLVGRVITSSTIAILVAKICPMDNCDKVYVIVNSMKPLSNTCCVSNNYWMLAYRTSRLVMNFALIESWKVQKNKRTVWKSILIKSWCRLYPEWFHWLQSHWIIQLTNDCVYKTEHDSPDSLYCSHNTQLKASMKFPLM